jgi:hypothetical protein
MKVAPSFVGIFGCRRSMPQEEEVRFLSDARLTQLAINQEHPETLAAALEE